MNNFEFYVDKILERLKSGNFKTCSFMEALALLVHEDAKTLCDEKCGGRCCAECLIELLEALKQEHVEQPKVTKRERAFLELVGSGWIARDSEGELYYYNQEPKKGSATWCGVPTKAHARIDNALGFYFEFIKWDEDEPRKVEDLLQLEVADT